MPTLTFIIAVVLSPLVAGPGAALCLIYLLAGKRQSALKPFWGALTLWNVSSLFVLSYAVGRMVSPHADLMLNGFIASLAMVTLILMRLATPSVNAAVDNDPERRRWYMLGTFLIPGMQLATVILLSLIASA